MDDREFELILYEIEELLGNKKMKAVKARLVDMNEADVAYLLNQLPNNHMVLVFRLLPKEEAAAVFAYLERDEQQHIIDSITDNEMSVIVEELFLDDVVDSLEEMPSNIVKRVMQAAKLEKRALINQFLQYPKSSAGSIMTSEFIDLKKDMNVEQAFDRIRRIGRDMETIYTCFVTSDNRTLEGVVTVKQLLLSNYTDKLTDIMDSNIISTSTHEDQEEVAELFAKYDLLNIPVVDSEDRLVGIITVDDVLDVIEAEATEDIEKMAAVTPTGRPYMKTGVITLFRTRIPWLLVLMIAATLTAMIIEAYEAALDAHVMLAAFIPMLMNTGGNTGCQTAVTVIRAMSLNEVEVRFTEYIKVLWKEIRVAVLCGVVLSGVNYLRLEFTTEIDSLISLAVSLTLVITILSAKVIGCTLPMAAQKANVDPAVMSSPFITTLVDAISLVIYFQIATILLGI